MAIVLVSAASSYSAAVTKTVTANNLVIFMASGAQASAWGTPVSSGAGTTGSWTSVQTYDGGPSPSTGMWWAKVTGSGSLTVTASGPTDLGVSIHEYSGADTTAPVETSNQNHGTGTTFTCALTGVSAGSMMVAIGSTENSSVPLLASSPFTRQTYEETHMHATSDYLAPSAASYTPTFTTPGSVDWTDIAASIKAAGGAPPPTFKAAGTFTAGTGAITPPYPGAPNAPVANDIAILVVESENQVISLTTPNGFVELGAQANKAAGTAAVDPASRLAVYWKRCAGGDSAPVVAAPGNHATARIYLFSGCKTSDNPWNVYAEGNDGGANDLTGVIPGATTTVAACLVFLICTSSYNSTQTTEFSTWANGDLANIVERGNNTNTTGLGGGHGSATGEKASVGAYGNTTVALAHTSYKGAMSIALAPVDAVNATVYAVTSVNLGASSPAMAKAGATATATPGASIEMAPVAAISCGTTASGVDGLAVGITLAVVVSVGVTISTCAGTGIGAAPTATVSIEIPATVYATLAPVLGLGEVVEATGAANIPIGAGVEIGLAPTAAIGAGATMAAQNAVALSMAASGQINVGVGVPLILGIGVGIGPTTQINVDFAFPVMDSLGIGAAPTASVSITAVTEVPAVPAAALCLGETVSVVGVANVSTMVGAGIGLASMAAAVITTTVPTIPVIGIGQGVIAQVNVSAIVQATTGLGMGVTPTEQVNTGLMVGANVGMGLDIVPTATVTVEAATVIMAVAAQGVGLGPTVAVTTGAIVGVQATMGIGVAPSGTVQIGVLLNACAANSQGVAPVVAVSGTALARGVTALGGSLSSPGQFYAGVNVVVLTIMALGLAIANVEHPVPTWISPLWLKLLTTGRGYVDAIDGSSSVVVEDSRTRTEV